jgi:hypothetical protein
MRKLSSAKKRYRLYQPLTERDVQLAILKQLYKDGWGTHPHIKHTNEKGVDIIVQNDAVPQRRFFIETKGESGTKSKYSMAETNFVYAIGQLITRMKVVDARYTYNYGLGLPEKSAKIALRRIPWQLAQKLCIYIFSVARDRKVIRYSSKDMRKIQEKKSSS